MTSQSATNSLSSSSNVLESHVLKMRVCLRCRVEKPVYLFPHVAGIMWTGGDATRPIFDPPGLSPRVCLHCHTKIQEN